MLTISPSAPSKGAEQLGYYAIAFNWGSLICVLLAGIVHQVLFPTFSKFQHDLLAMKGAYLESLKYVAFIAVPFNLFLAVLGREFLYHILGGNTERWLPALQRCRYYACMEFFGHCLSRWRT